MLDLLLPQRCLACGTGGAQLCTRCRDHLPRLQPPFCQRCGAPTAWPVTRCRECAGRRLAFSSARAALAYDPAVRALVAGWKEQGLRGLATLAAALVEEVVPRPEAAGIAIVPADDGRQLQRGHHPPARLALELGRRWDLPVLHVLRRTRRIRPQRGLDRAARRQNVAGAFRSSGTVPPRIVLVDDVYTSGATASAAASALRAGGARSVEVVTLARAIRAA